jgi:hypothetical protein
MTFTVPTRGPHAGRTFPDEPVCWSWPMPAEQVEPTIAAVKEWQADRCAVCGKHATVLDHDHDWRRACRGYLCYSCNYYESRTVVPVLDLYRQRPPFRILGIYCRYGFTRGAFSDPPPKDLFDNPAV